MAVFAGSLPGATPTLIGVAVGGYGLTQALLQIPLGSLSDRLGRPPVILLGLAVFAAGSILAAASDTIYGVIAGRLLQGAGAVSATLTALLADATRPEVRTRTMALFGIGIGSTFLLALVLGYVDQARHASTPDRQGEAVAGIEHAARRAAALTHQLLDFSRYGATRPVRFDARDALGELEPLLRQTLGRRIQLSVRVPAEPCPIVLDHAQFGLALLNLAGNSAQAIEGAGSFRIQLRPQPAQGVLAIRVDDDGPGIPADLQARVFEPFFTTKPAGVGTGLGLFVVRRLVEEAGGRIDLDSAPGTGTRITLELPLATDPEVGAALPDGAAAYQTSA